VRSGVDFRTVAFLKRGVFTMRDEGVGMLVLCRAAAAARAPFKTSKEAVAGPRGHACAGSAVRSTRLLKLWTAALKLKVEMYGFSLQERSPPP
jgi:hypothetical protein